MSCKITSKQILKILREEYPYLKEKYKVNSLSLFGSYIKNEQTNKSDADILVAFSETPGFLTFINLENYLSDKLGIKVDLVMKDALKNHIENRITQEAVSV